MVIAARRIGRSGQAPCRKRHIGGLFQRLLPFARGAQRGVGRPGIGQRLTQGFPMGGRRRAQQQRHRKSPYS
jgi:hypothetical protein